MSSRQLELEHRNEALMQEWAVKFYGDRQAAAYPPPWNWAARLWFEKRLREKVLVARLWLRSRPRGATVRYASPKVLSFRGRREAQ